MNKENSRDLVLYWCILYENVYQVKYLPNFKKDCSMIKKVLLSQYDSDYIKNIMEFTIHNYNVYWATESYPRPTLGALCSWMFNSAITKYEQKLSKNVQYSHVKQSVNKCTNDNFWEVK